jgi:Flp pilus assembly protein TadB
MARKKLRDIGTYDPETDGTLLYYTGYIVVLASVGAVALFIDTYIGWWNLLLGLVGLVVLGMLLAPRYFKYLPEFHFTSLDSRPHTGEVCAYEYGLTDEELAEIEELERILGQRKETAVVHDHTEQAELMVWRFMFFAIPGFLFLGWLEEGTWVTLTHVLVALILALLGWRWLKTFFGLANES